MGILKKVSFALDVLGAFCRELVKLYIPHHVFSLTRMMDGAAMGESHLVHLDVESLNPAIGEQQKQETSEICTRRKCCSHLKKKTFATFVASKRISSLWHCCDESFSDSLSIHKHVSNVHANEIDELTSAALNGMLQPAKADDPVHKSPNDSQSKDASSWTPDLSHLSEDKLTEGPGEVILCYCYSQVKEPRLICDWQNKLCSMLHLTGKVRVAKEGINATVGGTKTATSLYIKAMLAHPIFQVMQAEDFKTSDGGAECFSDLKVGVYKEIVPMGVDPDVISHKLAGTHLEPEEFHSEVRSLLKDDSSTSDTILLDCRNFYESKIGQFKNCLAPDIRKFSYFPDYVEKNLDLFRNKTVLMYCTGGIRCERGSAYLRSKNVCKEVYQLKGGIHKYLERFPDGFYRGKLFVFDERYSISFNSDVISDCRYCGTPWDQYQLCSTDFCYQLVLSCSSCRQKGLTACCPVCQAKEQTSSSSPTSGRRHKEECECTQSRPRIPKDTS